MLKPNKFGRDSRLVTARHFERVFKNAQKFRNQGITVLVTNSETLVSRLGIVVKKKQIPRAIDRNRIKRIIREAFRLNQNALNTPLDLVFLPYSTLLEQNNGEIKACLDYLWAKLIEFYNKS